MNNLVIIPKPDYISYEEITELLHAAYSERVAQGLYYPAAMQTAQQTRKRVGDGVCLVALMDKKLVGTITYKLFKKPNKTVLKKDKSYCIISQFATHPNLRNQGIGTKLWEHVKNIASNDELDAIYLDTAEPTKKLIDWYLHLGCEKVGYISHPHTNYFSVVLRKRINGKRYNRMYLKARYLASKMLCVLQYRSNGKIRIWRRAISKIKRCIKKNKKD